MIEKLIKLATQIMEGFIEAYQACYEIGLLLKHCVTVMETKTIAIRVNAEVARIFEAASEEQRRKLEALLSLKLSDATQSKRPLEDVMSDISRNAQARGLTPDILNSILNEE